MQKLTIEFIGDTEENELEAIRQFQIWLNEQGEQDYWQWMEDQVDEIGTKPVVVNQFRYLSGGGELTIRCPLAPLDEEGITL